MLIYNLEERGGKSLYEYLYICLRDDIKCGKIPAHSKLPSKRALSRQLGVSVITVKNAYEQLICEGYVTSVEKSGYYVLDVGHKTDIGDEPKFMTPPKDVKNDNIIYNLSSNTPNSEMFPFSVWSRLLRRVLAEEDAKLLRRVPSSGVYALRLAISRFLFESRGMDVSPDNIIIGAGTDYIYNLLTQLLGRNKRYGVENPGYKKIGDILSSCGVKFSYLEMDSFGVIPEKINKCDVIHISSSHHYPTGIIMPPWRRDEILEYANRHNAHIIDDDYDSEFRFTGKNVYPLFSRDGGKRVIYINTFSQTISPSIRISYMVLPDDLLHKFKTELGFYSCPVSSFEQYTLAAFISEGYFEKHINRMRNYYNKQRQIAIEAVYAQNNDKFVIMEEGAGMHFLLKINTSFSDAQIKQRCAERGLNISFVSDFLYRKKPEYESLAVINYTNTDGTQICEALKILSESV